jgi:hypothetical protein
MHEFLKNDWREEVSTFLSTLQVTRQCAVVRLCTTFLLSTELELWTAGHSVPTTHEICIYNVYSFEMLKHRYGSTPQQGRSQDFQFRGLKP